MIFRIIILILIFIMAGTALAAEKTSTSTTVRTITLPTIKVDLKPGPGMETTARYCSVCHSLDYITTQPAFSQKKWGEIVSKMVKVFGVPIPQDAAREITSYLGSAYGKPGQ
jgi:hypothetical protein